MKMMNKVLFILLIFYFQNLNCLIINPAIGILTDSNIYLAKIREFNYTNDEFHLIYHHNDPVYPLESFTSDNLLHRIYVCSPSTIYTLDLRIGAKIIPFSPVDDKPCRSSLTYIPNESALIWSLRHAIVQLDIQDMSKEVLWNSTSLIIDMIYNDTIIDDNIYFYLSITIANRQSAILHCRTDRRLRIFPFQNCFYVDKAYHEVSALAIDENRLYVADRIEQKIHVLTLLSTGYFLEDVLPLNTSTVADIRSMFIYNDNLIWLTTSGHVRSVSLITYEVRNIFWFDEPLRVIRLVSFSQWSNQTNTTTTRRSTTTQTSTSSTTQTSTSSTTPKDAIDTTTTDINDNSSPWKATTYVTSIILGIALFLCAAMITCILLNYRLGRVVPNSFTNIFHILRNRTSTTRSSQQQPLSDDSLA
jgi:hypothetical protein